MGGGGGGHYHCCDRRLFREGHRGVAGRRDWEMGADGACDHRYPGGIRLCPRAADLSFYHR